LVTIRLNSRVEKLSRDACASSVGGAKSVSPAITSAPSACLLCFRFPIASCTVCSRSTGSLTYTGSGPRIAAMRLPSAPCSSWVRIETGTSARSSSPSVRTPRVRSQRPSAPATTASTASFTVPPSPSLISLKSLRRLCTQRTRRCGPIGTLSGTSGAGLSPAQNTSPRPSTASRACSSEWPGWDSASSARPASETGVRISPLTPSATRSISEGSGDGVQPSSSGGSGGTGLRSNRTVAMSTPDTPSTSAWWVFEMTAKLVPSKPWISQTSQSGFERSSRCEKMRPTSWRSCSSEPGLGSAVWRTW
jgi:hypothetical protein